MTPADLRQIADSAGDCRALANALSVGKDWVNRRINGEMPIERVDMLAIQQVLETPLDNPVLRLANGAGSA